MTYSYWNSEKIIYYFDEPADCYFNPSLPIALCSYEKRTNTDRSQIPNYYFTHHPNWTLFDFLSNTPIECTEENIIPILSNILSHVYCSEITTDYSDIGCIIERVGDSNNPGNISPARIKKSKSGVFQVYLVVHDDTFDEKDEIIMMERIINIFPNRFHTKLCFIDYVDNNTIIVPNIKDFFSYKEITLKRVILNSRDSFFSYLEQ